MMTRHSSSFRAPNPADRHKSITPFYSNTTFLAGLCVFVYTFDIIAPGVAAPSFAGGSTYAGRSLINVATYWLVHRDLTHLCTNVSLLLLLGPRIERIMSEYKFFIITLGSLIAGGLTADQLECGICGLNGLVFAYAGIVFRYCQIEGVARQKKRSLYHFPSEVDLNLLLVWMLCCANLFTAPDIERDSEYAHMVTAFSAFLLINYVFAPIKAKKRRTVVRLSTRKTEENAGFVQSFRNALRRNNESDESDSDTPDPRSKRILNRIPGFRPRKGKKKGTKNGDKKKYDDDYSSEEEESDSGDEKPQGKGLYANIPKSKLKGRQRRAYSDESDRSD